VLAERAGSVLTPALIVQARLMLPK
jgi:hypothetical protein